MCPQLETVPETVPLSLDKQHPHTVAQCLELFSVEEVVPVKTVNSVHPHWALPPHTFQFNPCVPRCDRPHEEVGTS